MEPSISCIIHAPHRCSVRHFHHLFRSKRLNASWEFEIDQSLLRNKIHKLRHLCNHFAPAFMTR